jgi:preprotein translocase subunit SecF
MTMKNKFLAAAAAISLIAASGSAYAQAEKKMDAQGGASAQIEKKKDVQGGAKVQSQGGTQMQTQGGAKTEGSAKPGQAQQPSTASPSGKQAQQPSDEKPAQLSEQQRTQISTTISKQSNLKRVERSKINFTINVGSVVPRTIGLVPLPATLVAVVPAYRGYLYILVGNDLLIVHPRTYEIVAVIPA